MCSNIKMQWICLIAVSACSGAAVVTTTTTTTTTPTPTTSRPVDAALPRIERSLSDDDYNAGGYKTAGGYRWPDAAAASLTDEELSWELEPQVDKEQQARGKRFRGEARLVGAALSAVGREAATTVLARQQRNGRMYDVPQIGRDSIN